MTKYVDRYRKMKIKYYSSCTVALCQGVLGTYLKPNLVNFKFTVQVVFPSFGERYLSTEVFDSIRCEVEKLTFEQ